MEKAGKNQGVLLGIAGTITIAGLIQLLIKYIKNKISSEKKVELEGKAIIKKLKIYPTIPKNKKFTFPKNGSLFTMGV